MKKSQRSSKRRGPVFGRALAGSRRKKAPRRGKLVLRALYTLAPSAVVVVAVLLLNSWYTETQVSLDFTARRLAFTLAGQDQGPVLHPQLDFRSLHVENFSQLEFRPESREVDLLPGTGAAAGWQRREVAGALVLSPQADRDSSLRLESDDAGRGELGQIATPDGSEMVLEVYRGDPVQLNATVYAPQRTHVAIDGRLRIDARRVEVSGLAGAPVDGARPSLRVEKVEGSLISLQSQEPGLLLAIVPGSSDAQVLTGRSLAISELELDIQHPDGKLSSSLVAEATLGYPKYRGIASVEIRDVEIVSFEGIERAELTLTALDAANGGIAAEFAGIVARARADSEVLQRQLCLTMLQRFWEGPLWGILFTAAGWAFASGREARKLWREWRGESPA